MSRLNADDYSEFTKLLIRHRNLKVSSMNREGAMVGCIFHEDWNPSLGINFAKGQYHCFQCGKGGSLSALSKESEAFGKPITLVLNKIQDWDTLNSSEQIYPTEQPLVRRIFTPLDIRGRFIPYYNSDRALAYIKRRGITKEVADRMHFQYCAEAYINGTHFVDRLIIPVFDPNGLYMNVEGRALKEGDLKCLYPKKAIKPLYNWYELDHTQTLYLFEGLIKMAVARTDPFFANSSTTMGCQFSTYQLNKLQEFSSITLVRDMDDAGLDMAKKLKQIFNGNLHVWSLTNMAIKDVDEIPTDLLTTVKQYRESGGFVEEVEFMY